MQITFGKYQGKTVDWVAKADPDYARWAAGNLRNRQWSQAFERALRAAAQAPAAEVARVRAAAWSDGVEEAPYGEILDEVRRERAEQQSLARIADLERQWASEAGVPVEKVKAIVRMALHADEDWREWTASRFSGERQYSLFRRYMAEIEAEYEKQAQF